MAGLGTDFFPVFYKLGGGTPTPPQVEFYALRVDFPAVGVVDVIYVAQDESLAYIWDAALTVYAPLGNDGIEWYTVKGALPIPGVIETLYVCTTDAAIYFWDTTLAAYVSTGGLVYFNETRSTALLPKVSDVLEPGKGTVTADINFCVVPKGLGSLLADIPDNAATGGSSRGNNAVDLQMTRISNTQIASGENSVITGGYANSAQGRWAVVGGGYVNSVGSNGDYSLIVGGSSNTISSGGAYCVVVGGNTNSVDDTNLTSATIGGGYNNKVKASYSTIAGGSSNAVNSASQYGFVGGGSGCSTSANYGATCGGYLNVATSTYTFVGGGQSNNAGGTHSVVAGGKSNTIATSSNFGTIGGGSTNSIATSATAATIGGGQSCSIQASSSYGVVGGGYGCSIVSGSYAVVAGGDACNATGTCASVGGGRYSYARGTYATVSGGYYNATTNGYDHQTIGGGVSNTVSAESGTVGGGRLNQVYGTWGTIPGGNGNKIYGVGSVALGMFAGGTSTLTGAKYFSSGSPQGTITGELQTVEITPWGKSTSATPVTITTLGSVAVAVTNSYALPNNSLAKINGTVMVRNDTVAANFAIFEFSAYLNRDTTAASTAAIVPIVITPIASGGTGATWALAVNVNTTLGGIEIIGTGTAETLTWFGNVKIFESRIW